MLKIRSFPSKGRQEADSKGEVALHTEMLSGLWAQKKGSS